jgi:hypothetical protein
VRRLLLFEYFMLTIDVTDFGLSSIKTNAFDVIDYPEGVG